MRHRKGNAKLGRPTDQRLAMLRELASGVIYDTRIETTLVRAKAAGRISRS
jgi:ribosomal protein L17